MDNKCIGCEYFGKAADAPDTVEKDCMWVPDEDEDDETDAEGFVSYTKPCEIENEIKEEVDNE